MKSGWITSRTSCHRDIEIGMPSKNCVEPPLLVINDRHLLHQDTHHLHTQISHRTVGIKYNIAM
jgi:hypothetical protein